MQLVTTKYNIVCNTLFVVFWVLATYNFFVQELAGQEIPFIEQSVRIAAQGILAILGLWTLRKRLDIWVIVIFSALTLFSTLVVNHQSLMTWVDGVRLYVGFLFVVPIIRYLLSDEEMRAGFVARMDRTAYRFLWLQVPCIMWQSYIHANPDLAGGSLGWMMSGVVSNMIYLCSFYLMLRRWDKAKSYLTNLWENRILIFLLFPSFLNETKVSFVLMVMYFFFLVPMDRKYIHNLMWIAPLIAVFFGVALYLYTNKAGRNEQVTDMAVTSTYLIGDEAALNLVENVMENNYEDEDNTDFARGLKLAITPAIMNRNPPSWYVGYGIGQYKVGDAAKKVEFAKQYDWLLQGTMLQGHVIWLETGLIGVALYFIYWMAQLRMFKRHVPRNRQLQWFLGLNILIFTFYNAPMLVLPFCILFLYLTLVSGWWNTLPPYRTIRLLGSRPIRWQITRTALENDKRKEGV